MPCLSRLLTFVGVCVAISNSGRVLSLSTSDCTDGKIPISVAGATSIGCATPPVCVADVKDGNCPENSYCGIVFEGNDQTVYGCRLNGTANNNACRGHGDANNEVSVVGLPGVYCARGPVCSGVDGVGLCPTKIDNPSLDNDTICTFINGNVYGCISADEANSFCDGSSYGYAPVSVSSAGTFCVNSANICSGDHKGECPGPQPGLVNGSICQLLPEEKSSSSSSSSSSSAASNIDAVPVFGCVIPN